MLLGRRTERERNKKKGFWPSKIENIEIYQSAHFRSLERGRSPIFVDLVCACEIEREIGRERRERERERERNEVPVYATVLVNMPTKCKIWKSITEREFICLLRRRERN